MSKSKILDAYGKISGPRSGPKNAVISRPEGSELITPEIATEMLKKCAPNRSLSKARVALFSMDMVAGEWDLNGETIVLDLEGYVIDGVHRLTACVESGCSFWTVVVRGVQRKAGRSIDSGRSRTYANVLAMNGVGSSGRLASALAWLGKTLKGPVAIKAVHSATTRAQNDVLFAEYPELDESVRLFLSEQARILMRGADRVGSYSALRCILMRSGYRAQAVAFFDALISGAGMDDLGVVSNCRDRLILASQSQVKHAAWGPFLVGVLSWNGYARGEAVTKATLREAIDGKRKFPSRIVGGPVWPIASLLS